MKSMILSIFIFSSILSSSVFADTSSEIAYACKTASTDMGGGSANPFSVTACLKSGAGVEKIELCAFATSNNGHRNPGPFEDCLKVQADRNTILACNLASRDLVNGLGNPFALNDCLKSGATVEKINVCAEVTTINGHRNPFSFKDCLAQP